MRLSSSYLASNATFSRKCILIFAVGITFGFSISHILMSVSSWEKTDRFWNNLCTLYHDHYLHKSLQIVEEPQSDVSSHRSGKEFQKDEAGVAEKLAQTVRVLCWVMTAPDNHERKAKPIKATWGSRCNILLFMSSQEDKDLPTIALDVQEGRDYLWAKTKQAFAYVHKHYLDAADWFLKADDDTYIIVENLRYMLQSHSPDEPIYFGRRFVKHVEQGYMSGGAGYVLSREALKRFVENALPDHEKCWEDHGGAEDAEIGKCLGNVGVVTGNSRDDAGRGRFYPFVPEQHLIPGYLSNTFWYWDYTNSTSAEGADCCSDTAISFHYISPDMMYVFDYFLYHLRAFGISIRPIEADVTGAHLVKGVLFSTPEASITENITKS